MLIIVDKKIPEEAKHNLRMMGELMELETTNITYPAISGHPDIFFSQLDDLLVVAPNLPSQYYEKLNKKRINYKRGKNPIGEKYPESARYNAAISTKHLVHNPKITDSAIEFACDGKTKINVNQGYVRCNLIFLDDVHAIGSDAGVAKKLTEAGIDTLLLNPHGIMLPGFDHGFFGGCCGIFDKKLFVLGNLDKFPDGEKVLDFLAKVDFEIIELCDTPLFDGGGVFFIG